MGLFGLFKKKNGPKSPELSIKVEVKTVSEMHQDDVIPIEKRIKGKKPICDGLYPHEVLVLSYAPRYSNEETDYPRFWWNYYGIKDVSKILLDLQKRGYLEVGSIADALNYERITVVREELKKRELKASGKKDELVARLLENVDEEELSLVFTKRPYSLTTEGKNTLAKFPWIPYIHNQRIDGLDIWTLTEMVQASPEMSFRDLIWRHFNDLSIQHIKAGDWGLYRNAHFQMSEFMAE